MVKYPLILQHFCQGRTGHKVHVHQRMRSHFRILFMSSNTAYKRILVLYMPRCILVINRHNNTAYEREYTIFFTCKISDSQLKRQKIWALKQDCVH